MGQLCKASSPDDTVRMTESEDNQEEKELDAVDIEILKSQGAPKNLYGFESSLATSFLQQVFLWVFSIGGTILLLGIVGYMMPSTDTVITGFMLFLTSPWFHIPLIFITWLICAISFMRKESLTLRLILLTLIFILYVFSYPLVTS